MPNQPAGQSARPLVEGALLASLTVALVLAANFIPLFSLLAIVSPTPLVVAVVRHGLRIGAMAGTVVTMLMLAFFGPLAGMVGGITLTAVALGLGFGLRRRWPVEATLGLSTLVFMSTMVLSLWISLRVMGIDVFDQLFFAMRESFALSTDLADRLNQILGTEGQAAIDFEEMLEILQQLIPAILVMGGGFAAFLTYLISGATLRRLGTPVPGIPPFARWQLPTTAVYVFAGLNVLTLALDYGGSTALKPALMNAQWILLMAITVNGLATAYYFLRRWRISKFLAVVLLVFAFMNQWIGALFIWLGLLEPLLKVRQKYGGLDTDSGGEGT